jgi:3-phosphoinositide dependent protein kinase-1
LKPENLLLGEKWRVKVTDFGTAKIIGADVPFELERGSFVGSADYVSPEVLGGTVVGPAADLWAVGCITYALLAGAAPFHSDTQYETFQRIQALDYSFPPNFPEDAQELVRAILQIEPEERIGYGEFADNYTSIRNHRFFAGVDWDGLPEAELPEMGKPPVAAQAQAAPAAAAAAAGQGQGQGQEQSAPASEVAILLVPGEKIVLEGTVLKKRGFSTKERRLVLTDMPRLFYVNMKDKTIKGEIPLSAGTKVVLLKGAAWAVEVPGRVYSLTSKGDVQPANWQKAIQERLPKQS